MCGDSSLCARPGEQEAFSLQKSVCCTAHKGNSFLHALLCAAHNHPYFGNLFGIPHNNSWSDRDETPCDVWDVALRRRPCYILNRLDYQNQFDPGWYFLSELLWVLSWLELVAWFYKQLATTGKREKFYDQVTCITELVSKFKRSKFINVLRLISTKPTNLKKWNTANYKPLTVPTRLVVEWILEYILYINSITKTLLGQNVHYTIKILQSIWTVSYENM